MYDSINLEEFFERVKSGQYTCEDVVKIFENANLETLYYAINFGRKTGANCDIVGSLQSLYDLKTMELTRPHIEELELIIDTDHCRDYLAMKFFRFAKFIELKRNVERVSDEVDLKFSYLQILGKVLEDIKRFNSDPAFLNRVSELLENGEIKFGIDDEGKGFV